MRDEPKVAFRTLAHSLTDGDFNLGGLNGHANGGLSVNFFGVRGGCRRFVVVVVGVHKVEVEGERTERSDEGGEGSSGTGPLFPGRPEKASEEKPDEDFDKFCRSGRIVGTFSDAWTVPVLSFN